MFKFVVQYFQVNRTHFDNIIVGCIFVFFIDDNSRELPFKTISFATYIIIYDTIEPLSINRSIRIFTICTLNILKCRLCQYNYCVRL